MAAPTKCPKWLDYFSLLLFGGELLPNHRQLATEIYAAAETNRLGSVAGFLMSLPAFQKQ